MSDMIASVLECPLEQIVHGREQGVAISVEITLG